jgi:2-phosphoglycerate kinase
MERRGYGEEYINRYNMMTKFHHQRVPLVILVCGTACVGKSTIATQLAQRLNLPNVLQTDMVYELLRTATDAPLTSTPVWTREFGSSEELITEFCRECRIVRKGLGGDLKKAMKDGKPIIIEVNLFVKAPYIWIIFRQLHLFSNLGQVITGKTFRSKHILNE